MKNVRLVTLALSIGLFAACAAKNDGKTDSQSSPDSVAGPGVGTAPDNSRELSDSLTQEADTTTLKKP